MTKKENPHSGHRQRLKERFLKTGLDNFQPHEILELLLFYSRPRIDTNEMAHALLNKFGNITKVFDADIQDIAEVDGVGENSAILIKMVPQLAKAYCFQAVADDKLDTSKKVCNYFYNSFLGTRHEQLKVACLDDNLRVVACGTVIEGGLSSVSVNIRKIVEFTYRSKCEMIIIAHNHPNGDAYASDSDVKATEKIFPVLKSVGIRLLDHIVVSPKQALSMYDAGYFSEMR